MQSDQHTAALANGGWVVTWGSFQQDGDGSGLYQQVYGVDGKRVGDETRINTVTEGDQDNQQVAALADGGWVVCWSVFDNVAWGNHTYLQAFNPNGTMRGSETEVDSIVTGNDPKIASLADGGWIVTRQDHGLYQAVYNSDGTIRMSEAEIPDQSVNGAADDKLTALEGGGWVVTWASWQGLYTDIYQQAFNADGSEMASAARVNTFTKDDQRAPETVALADGG